MTVLNASTLRSRERDEVVSRGKCCFSTTAGAIGKTITKTALLYRQPYCTQTVPLPQTVLTDTLTLCHTPTQTPASFTKDSNLVQFYTLTSSTLRSVSMCIRIVTNCMQTCVQACVRVQQTQVCLLACICSTHIEFGLPASIAILVQPGLAENPSSDTQAVADTLLSKIFFVSYFLRGENLPSCGFHPIYSRGKQRMIQKK